MKSPNSLVQIRCLLLLIVLFPCIELLAFAQENATPGGSSVQAAISVEAQLILFQQYQKLIFAISSPPQGLDDNEKGQYVLSCLHYWKNGIMFMGAWFDKIKDDDEMIGLHQRRSFFSMPPVILENWYFSSRGRRLGYYKGKEIADEWRKSIADEKMKIISNNDVDYKSKFTRTEKINNHPQIEALLYLYTQLKYVSPSDDPCTQNEASISQTEQD